MAEWEDAPSSGEGEDTSVKRGFRTSNKPLEKTISDIEKGVPPAKAHWSGKEIPHYNVPKSSFEPLPGQKQQAERKWEDAPNTPVQPQKSKKAGGFLGEGADVADMILGMPGAMAHALSWTTSVPVEYGRELLGKVKPGESPDPVQRAKEKTDKLFGTVAGKFVQQPTRTTYEAVGGSSAPTVVSETTKNTLGKGMAYVTHQLESAGLSQAAAELVVEDALNFGIPFAVGKGMKLMKGKATSGEKAPAKDIEKSSTLGKYAKDEKSTQPTDIGKALEWESVPIDKLKLVPKGEEVPKYDRGLDYNQFEAEMRARDVEAKLEERKQSEIDRAYEAKKRLEQKQFERDKELFEKYGRQDYEPSQMGGTKSKTLGRKGQRGEADPQLLATLGLTAGGMALGGYLAGDEKIAGAVLGGITGFGASRVVKGLDNLKTVVQDMGKRKLAGEAVRAGAIIGGGAYVGQEHDAPVEGALLGSLIVAGRHALPKARPMAQDDLIRMRNGNIEAYNRVIGNAVREINEAVPDKARREAIADAIDRGDLSKLNDQELKVARAVKGFLKDLGEEGMDTGVLKGLREDYISHIVEWDKSVSEGDKSSILKQVFGNLGEGGTGGSASPKSKFGKERKYATFDELNAAIKDTGLKIKTQDVGEILDIYAKSMRRAIENKNLIDSLRKGDGPAADSFLYKVSEKRQAPQGWKYLSHPQLQGYAVHPDLESALKTVFSSDDPGIVLKGLLAANQVTKRLNVSGSMFHAKSLAEVAINAFGRDVFKAKSAIDSALDRFRNGGLGDETDLLIREGLRVGDPVDITRTAGSDLGGAVDTLLSKASGKDVTAAGKMGAGADKFLGMMDNLTWDYLHTGIKLAIAHREFERLSLANPDMKPNEVARKVATYVNDLAGGLDWFGIAADAKTQLGRNLGMYFASPNGMKVAQVLAFAPDWALSTLRAGFKAFGEGTGISGWIKPQNEVDLYRRYAARSSLYWATVLNGMNMMTSGHPIWENKDPTRLEMDDGTSMQVGKHTFEMYHAIDNPVKFAYNKMGFSARMAADLFKETSGYGPGAQPYGTFVENAARSALPFSASPFMDPALDSKEATERAVLSFLGVPKYGYTASERALAREERKKRGKKSKQRNY